MVQLANWHVRDLLCEYRVYIWHLDSDFITPHQQSPSSAQQELGSNDNKLFLLAGEPRLCMWMLWWRLSLWNTSYTLHERQWQLLFAAVWRQSSKIRSTATAENTVWNIWAHISEMSCSTLRGYKIEDVINSEDQHQWKQQNFREFWWDEKDNRAECHETEFKYF